jgi:hypothetical protein
LQIDAHVLRQVGGWRASGAEPFSEIVVGPEIVLLAEGVGPGIVLLAEGVIVLLAEGGDGTQELAEQAIRDLLMMGAVVAIPMNRRSYV